MIWLGIDLGDARTGVAISVSGSMTRSYRLIEGKGLKKTAIEVANEWPSIVGRSVVDHKRRF